MGRAEPSVNKRRGAGGGLRGERRANGDTPKPGRNKSPRGRLLSILLKWTLVLGIWAAVVVGLVLAYFAFTLPDLSGIDKFNRRPSLSFVAADGQVLATYGDLYGGVVELRDMPPWLPHAVIATEDRRFYDHFGIDVIGLARASYVNLRAGRVVQGGSTITQQLAKNVFLTHERTLNRKIQETMLALWLERRFTKDQILTIYLNRVYLGAGTYGVEAAARRYFGKSAREVTRLEAAVIAGLLKAPSRYSPAASLERAKARAVTVLNLMEDRGFLTTAQLRAAEREQLRLPSGTGGNRGVRYFADWLLDAVPGFVGYVDRDLTIVTTLDGRLQRAAETAITTTLDREGARARVSQGALVAMSPDGAVRAMVGGRDYGESQFNRATDAQRQPGSSFKPFVFLAAVEAGLNPDDRIDDSPVMVGDYSPKNFDTVRKGLITAREAVARSVNTATVRTAQRVGIDRVIAVAHRLGVSSDLRRDMSTSLGASEVNLLELTGAFAPFANGGNGVLPYAIVEIRDSSGQVLYRRGGSGPGRVIQRGPLAAMVDMLGSVVTSGTGRAAALDRPVIGKTGTSQDYRDAWFVGGTASYVAGVWLGNDDSQPMQQVTGGGLPARLWRSFMVEAHRGVDAHSLPGVSSGFDLDGFFGSLFRGGSSPSDAPAPSSQRQRSAPNPSSTGTSNDPMNRPGAPALN
jgi:penicillin-binding protein 1A